MGANDYVDIERFIVAKTADGLLPEKYGTRCRSYHS